MCYMHIETSWPYYDQLTTVGQICLLLANKSPHHNSPSPTNFVAPQIETYYAALMEMQQCCSWPATMLKLTGPIDDGEFNGWLVMLAMIMIIVAMLMMAVERVGDNEWRRIEKNCEYF